MRILPRRRKGIDHLDFQPTCGDSRHQHTPPAADFWLDQHGCWDTLTCTDCFQRDHSYYSGLIADGGTVRCLVCATDFTDLDALFRLTPLRLP
ncbi:hypothetical protein [Nocardia thailandica]|uniref:hypothetical protein n=1 Tax=Nocardia thailandica TaxID=257275 RepID=UPI000309A74A|nr:hypothetical protein [Nocardia thailandica]